MAVSAKNISTAQPLAGQAARTTGSAAESSRAVQVAGLENPDYTLVCFHHAGAGAAAYRDWLARPPAGARLCAVSFPGREKRLHEAPYVSMEAAVAGVAAALEPFLGGRLAFYGHSMGGLIAFALARHMAEAGAQLPEHIFLGACEAPGGDPRPPSFHGAWTVEDVAALLRRLGGTSPEVLADRDLLSLVAPALVADLGVCDGYVVPAGTRVPVPITAFAGQADPMVSLSTVARWSQFTTGTFTLVPVRAGHFFPAPVMREVLNTLDGVMSSSARYGRVMNR